MKHRYFVDEKVTIWRRTSVVVDNLEDEKDIIEEIKKHMKDEPTDNVKDLDASYLLETSEELPVDENNGHSTLEIFEYLSGDLIYSNGKP